MRRSASRRAGDPRYMMERLGHTDPKFTLRVYAQAMRF
jgi:hypothetical protein